ncbi:MAG: methylmalonyl-CoA carboxyltransferase [Deltaproteobacteria bacterium]|nr:methylmalonyl-CoA carboxyltransferase [Deltaproteobacteria bacterium]
MKKKLDEFNAVKERLSFGGGKAAIEKQHAAGKLTAWERMGLLFDPGTFKELDLLAKPFKTGFDIDNRELPRDAIVTGYGTVNGRKVYASCYDYTVSGGSQGSMQMMKLVKVMEQARKEGLPYVAIIDSTGRRIQDRFGKFGYRVPIRVEDCGEGNIDMFCPPMASGVIPQISLMLGPCYAGTAYCPMMSDFLIFRKELSFMSVASPTLLKSATGAVVTQDEIGGALLHATTTGSADLLADSDEEAIAQCRQLLGFLPSNWTEKPPHSETLDDPQRLEEELLFLLPAEEDKPLDMHRLISLIVDEGQLFEIAPLYARNMVTGFARLAGQAVGIVANNGMVAEGSLDANGCDKEAHFIRTCDCFNIPLIFLVDSPGFLPSLEQEQGPDGIERHAAKPVFAICEATVPKVVVYVRKVFGSSRLIMGGRGMNVDSVIAWPSVRFNFGNYPINEPDASGAVMAFEEVIDPRETRPILIERLHRLSGKLSESRPWRKHGLIQL